MSAQTNSTRDLQTISIAPSTTSHLLSRRTVCRSILCAFPNANRICHRLCKVSLPADSASDALSAAPSRVHAINVLLHPHTHSQEPASDVNCQTHTTDTSETSRRPAQLASSAERTLGQEAWLMSIAAIAPIPLTWRSPCHTLQDPFTLIHDAVTAGATLQLEQALALAPTRVDERNGVCDSAARFEGKLTNAFASACQHGLIDLQSIYNARVCAQMTPTESAERQAEHRSAVTIEQQSHCDVVAKCTSLGPRESIDASMSDFKCTMHQDISQDWNTPLHIAVGTGQPACVETLMRLGADEHLPDAQGRNSIQLAWHLQRSCELKIFARHHQTRRRRAARLDRWPVPRRARSRLLVRQVPRLIASSMRILQSGLGT